MVTAEFIVRQLDNASGDVAVDERHMAKLRRRVASLPEGNQTLVDLEH